MNNNLLTQEELNNLPDRTKIIVIWSGGNGPHEYVLRQTDHGLYVEDSFLEEPNWKGGSLDFVGTEKYHTKVRIKN